MRRFPADSVHGFGKRRPRLDLDDRYEIAAPGNQVDLAELRAVAARHDAIAFEHQGHGREPFAAVAAPVCAGARRLVSHRGPL